MYQGYFQEILSEIQNISEVLRSKSGNLGGPKTAIETSHFLLRFRQTFFRRKYLMAKQLSALIVNEEYVTLFYSIKLNTLLITNSLYILSIGGISKKAFIFQN